MNQLITALLLVSVTLLSSCSSSETDGRKYSNSSPSPLQSKMGVSYMRVKVPGLEATPAQKKTVESDGLLGALTGTEDGPPGLLDRNAKPDEPGAVYYMHGQQSPSPVQGKMGVRVSRRKK
jgi:hypothetical protein